MSLCTALPLAAKVRGSEVMYVSGTVREVPEKTEGHLFQPKHNELQFLSKEGEIVIPLARVRTASYREEFVDKTAAAKAAEPKKKTKLPLLPALPGMPNLNPFGEDKQRVLTLTYTDKQGGEQKVVLLLARKMVSPVIYALETHGNLEVVLEPGDYDLDD
ncbi:MAG: hypothetical protein ABI972_11865 [Acidobacteriota bacterium]